MPKFLITANSRDLWLPDGEKIVFLPLPSPDISPVLGKNSSKTPWEPGTQSAIMCFVKIVCFTWHRLGPWGARVLNQRPYGSWSTEIIWWKYLGQLQNHVSMQYVSSSISKIRKLHLTLFANYGVWSVNCELALPCMWLNIQSSQHFGDNSLSSDDLQ